MRQIALDTETTGIGNKHKIIEIGCIEIIDRVITENNFHIYLNPQRPVDEAAFRVHGISNEFLQDKPLFLNILDDFLEFISDSELIIHNAPFDTGFLNYELQCANSEHKIENICKVFDTLPFAKRKHPGQRNSLDALCKRYEIDNSNRQLHGALLDAELLARVYLQMTGGQTTLFGEDSNLGIKAKTNVVDKGIALSSKTPIILASSDELKKHQEFLDFIKDNQSG